MSDLLAFTTPSTSIAAPDSSAGAAACLDRFTAAFHACATGGWRIALRSY